MVAMKVSPAPRAKTPASGLISKDDASSTISSSANAQKGEKKEKTRRKDKATPKNNRVLIRKVKDFIIYESFPESFKKNRFDFPTELSSLKLEERYRR
jgi:hypothetical protein